MTGRICFDSRRFLVQGGAVGHKDFVRCRARVAALHVRGCLASWAPAQGLPDDEFESLVLALVKLLNANATMEAVADLLGGHLTSFAGSRPEMQRLAKQLLERPYEVRFPQ